MFTRVPSDIQKFADFINATDDCQSAQDPIGFTIYPRTPEGKFDFQSKDKVEVKNQPNYKRWDWTAEESETWSDFRRQFNEAFAKYSANKKDTSLKTECEEIISSFINYDQEHHLLDRIADCDNTTGVQRDLFNIRQDVLEIKTPLRTIKVQYEKAIPLNEFEKHFLDRFKALHEHAVDVRKQAKKLRTKISNLGKQLTHIFEQYPVMREKSDKASNRLFIPSPKMKGSQSEVVAFKVPTLEEAQKNREDYMQYATNFHAEYSDMYEALKKIEAEENTLDNIYDESEAEYKDPFFKEYAELRDKIFDSGKCISLDAVSLDEQQDEFYDAWGTVSEEIDNAHDEWNDFVDRYNVLNAVYSNFIKFSNAEMPGGAEDDDDDEIEYIDLSNTESNSEEQDEEKSELDELQAETIERYNAAPTAWFDMSEWHIILDHFERRFDRKNFAEALQRAWEQHPEDVTMQLRKAQELANEHQYQPALDLLKKAEAQGPPHHPKLFFVKAQVYRNLQSPDLAIPQYKRIISQDNDLLKEWKKYAYENLIDIYDAQKKYDDCLQQALELLALYPDDELVVNKAAWAYNAAGKSAEAEDVVMRYLKHHPKSGACRERLGYIFFDRKEYQKAIEHFNKAFAADREEYYSALYHKGLAQMELKEYDEAAISFEHYLLYFKLSVESHVGAAKAYDKLGMPEQVIYHYRQALAIDPDCKEAVDYLLELNKKKISS